MSAEDSLRLDYLERAKTCSDIIYSHGNGGWWFRKERHETLRQAIDSALDREGRCKANRLRRIIADAQSKLVELGEE